MVPPLSAFFFLALGVVNAVAAEEPLNKVVGLGEACDAAAGIGLQTRVGVQRVET